MRRRRTRTNETQFLSPQAWLAFSIIGCGALITFQVLGLEHGVLPYIFSYLPLFLVGLAFYTVSFLAAMGFLFKQIQLKSWIFVTHFVALLFFAGVWLYRSDVFKSPILYEAYLIDDLSGSHIKLREVSSYEEHLSGFFGFSEYQYGTYELRGDTILINSEIPSSSFLKKRMLLDRKQHAILLQLDSLGGFNNELEWLNHFSLMD